MKNFFKFNEDNIEILDPELQEATKDPKSLVNFIDDIMSILKNSHPFDGDDVSADKLSAENAQFLLSEHTAKLLWLVNLQLIGRLKESDKASTLLDAFKVGHIKILGKFYNIEYLQEHVNDLPTLANWEIDLFSQFEHGELNKEAANHLLGLVIILAGNIAAISKIV